ncbi:conserved hypothetical protein [Ricinus communis]|uniref:Uncharacterized protein n=1 Tax=Ricinus communis TaxID=3988 RepID=B9S0T5_RICCO|nr:conserved hypothetical protein [Ricinus communis]
MASKNAINVTHECYPAFQVMLPGSPSFFTCLLLPRMDIFGGSIDPDLVRRL